MSFKNRRRIELNITYERSVEHCKPSEYVRYVSIKEVKPAINSDNLEIVLFEKIGWNALSQKGMYKVGDRVTFVPAGSVLPFELSEAMKVTKYLSKGRVRVVRLRGNRSEGLIIDRRRFGEYLPYILQWEDPPSKAMGGNALAMEEVPPYFHKFYKIPNILNEPNIFEFGEEIYFSEKLHGSNTRIAKLPHPDTGIYQLYVGSHNTVLKPEPETVYWRAAKEIEKILPSNILFFGEVYGKGIQHLDYEEDLAFKIFAASIKGEYIPIPELINFCEEYGLPMVNFKKTAFTSVEQLRYLAEEPSEYTDKHEREGIVAVSEKHPERMAKCISFEYLAGNPGTKRKNKRTERH